MRDPYGKIGVKEAEGIDDSPKGSELLICGILICRRVLFVYGVVPVSALFQSAGIEFLHLEIAGLIHGLGQLNQAAARDFAGLQG